MKNFKEATVGKLKVRVFNTREEIGKSAAIEASQVIIELQKRKNILNLLFASAPSQNDFIKNFVDLRGINWSEINAFHMDEFLGLDFNDPASFSNYLKKRLFDKIDFRDVFYINGKAKNIEKECERYENLLKENPIDFAFIGIGENGHIAFNDPHIADFNDKKLVKINDQLDDICRNQQVNDGHFKELKNVPNQAITLTIPALVNSKNIFAIVPGKLKQKIIKRVLEGPITEDCPGSIIRNYDNAVLYLDSDSASLLNF